MIFVFVVLVRISENGKKGRGWFSFWFYWNREVVMWEYVWTWNFMLASGLILSAFIFHFIVTTKSLSVKTQQKRRTWTWKKMRFLWLNICVDICCCLSRRRQLGEAFKCFSTVLSGLEIISTERRSRRSLCRFLRTRKEWKGISNLSFNPTHKRMKTRERTKKRVKNRS